MAKKKDETPAPETQNTTSEVYIVKYHCADGDVIKLVRESDCGPIPATWLHGEREKASLMAKLEGKTVEMITVVKVDI